MRMMVIVMRNKWSGRRIIFIQEEHLGEASKPAHFVYNYFERPWWWTPTAYRRLGFFSYVETFFFGTDGQRSSAGHRYPPRDWQGLCANPGNRIKMSQTFLKNPTRRLERAVSALPQSGKLLIVQLSNFDILIHCRPSTIMAKGVLVWFCPNEINVRGAGRSYKIKQWAGLGSTPGQLMSYLPPRPSSQGRIPHHGELVEKVIRILLFSLITRRKAT